MINLVRKQAEAAQRPSMSLGLNSLDSGTLTFSADQGGAWNDQTFWRVLGNGSATGRTEGGYTGQHSAGVMGTRSWLGLAFKAALTVQSDRNRLTPARASRGGVLPEGDRIITPVEDGEQPPLDPTDRVLNHASDVDVDLEWRLVTDWRLNWKGRIESVQADILRHQKDSLFNPMRRVDSWRAAMQSGLQGDVVTGSVRHKLLLGLDLERWRTLDDGVLVLAPWALATVDTNESRLSLLLQDQLRCGPWRVRLGYQWSCCAAPRAKGGGQASA